MKLKTMILAMLLLAFALLACAPAERLNIRDFGGLKELPEKAATLKVEYEDELTGEFEITDEATVKEVMGLLLSGSYIRRERSGQPAAGNNGRMTVVSAEGREFRISLHKLSAGGYDYTPETGALLQKLKEIGTEYGALKVR